MHNFGIFLENITESHSNIKCNSNDLTLGKLHNFITDKKYFNEQQSCLRNILTRFYLTQSPLEIFSQLIKTFLNPSQNPLAGNSGAGNRSSAPTLRRELDWLNRQQTQMSKEEQDKAMKAIDDLVRGG